jgi:hypothetical protein
VSVYRQISAERAHCEAPGLPDVRVDRRVAVRLLGVGWRPPSDRGLTDPWLTERIRSIYVATRLHARL